MTGIGQRYEKISKKMPLSPTGRVLIQLAAYDLLQHEIVNHRAEILAEYEALRKVAIKKVWGEAFTDLSKAVVTIDADERLRRRRQAKQQKKVDGKWVKENKAKKKEAAREARSARRDYEQTQGELWTDPEEVKRLRQAEHKAKLVAGGATAADLRLRASVARYKQAMRTPIPDDRDEADEWQQNINQLRDEVLEARREVKDGPLLRDKKLHTLEYTNKRDRYLFMSDAIAAAVARPSAEGKDKVAVPDEFKSAAKVFKDEDASDEKKEAVRANLQLRFPNVLPAMVKAHREETMHSLVNAKKAPGDSDKTTQRGRAAVGIGQALGLTEESQENTALLVQAMSNVADRKNKSNERFTRLIQFAGGTMGVDPAVTDSAVFITESYGKDIARKAHANKARYGGMALPVDEGDIAVAMAAKEQWRNAPKGSGSMQDYVARAVANQMNQRAASLRKQDILQSMSDAGNWPASEVQIIDRDGDVVARSRGKNGQNADAYVSVGLQNVRNLKGSTVIRTRTFGGPTTEDIKFAMKHKVDKLIVVSGNGRFEIGMTERGKGIHLRFHEIAGDFQKIRQSKKQNYEGSTQTLTAIKQLHPYHIKTAKSFGPSDVAGAVADTDVPLAGNQFLDLEKGFNPSYGAELIADEKASPANDPNSNRIKRHGERTPEADADNARVAVKSALDFIEGDLGRVTYKFSGKPQKLTSKGADLTFKNLSVEGSIDSVDWKFIQSHSAHVGANVGVSPEEKAQIKSALEESPAWMKTARLRYKDRRETFNETFRDIVTEDKFYEMSDEAMEKFKKIQGDDRPIWDGEAVTDEDLLYVPTKQDRDGSKPTWAHSQHRKKAAQVLRLLETEGLLNDEEKSELGVAYAKAEEARIDGQVAYTVNSAMAMNPTYAAFILHNGFIHENGAQTPWKAAKGAHTPLSGGLLGTATRLSPSNNSEGLEIESDTDPVEMAKDDIAEAVADANKVAEEFEELDTKSEKTPRTSSSGSKPASLKTFSSDFTAFAATDGDSLFGQLRLQDFTKAPDPASIKEHLALDNLFEMMGDYVGEHGGAQDAFVGLEYDKLTRDKKMKVDALREWAVISIGEAARGDEVSDPPVNKDGSIDEDRLEEMRKKLTPQHATMLRVG